MSAWINVKDRLPEDSERVLIVHNGSVVIASLEWEYPHHEDMYEKFQYWETENLSEIEWFDVTYWQPLPTVPKEEEDEQ
jgi:hypothetical protein